MRRKKCLRLTSAVLHLVSIFLGAERAWPAVKNGNWAVLHLAFDPLGWRLAEELKGDDLCKLSEVEESFDHESCVCEQGLCCWRTIIWWRRSPISTESAFQSALYMLVEQAPRVTLRSPMTSLTSRVQTSCEALVFRYSSSSSSSFQHKRLYMISTRQTYKHGTHQSTLHPIHHHGQKLLSCELRSCIKSTVGSGSNVMAVRSSVAISPWEYNMK